MYIIMRLDQRGGYVSKPNSEHSYTKDALNARRYSTREAAEKDRCGNEIVINLLQLIQETT